MKPLPEIIAVRWTPDDVGYPWLEIDFADGRTGMVDWELKVLRMGYDAVFLGPDFEPHTEWTIPADHANGRGEPVVLRGFTEDPHIVALAKEFLVAMQEGEFVVGVRAVTVHFQ